MKIELTKANVEKILSTMSTEQIEQKLETNCSYWVVSCEAMHPITLQQKEKEDG